MDTSANDELLGFSTRIKGLFRERDRDSMKSHFDLWSYDDVRSHAPSILTRLQNGSMPCDGAWPPEQVDLFKQWIESGMPA
jgi:hypothetical protein